MHCLTSGLMDMFLANREVDQCTAMGAWPSQHVRHHLQVNGAGGSKRCLRRS